MISPPAKTPTRQMMGVQGAKLFFDVHLVKMSMYIIHTHYNE